MGMGMGYESTKTLAELANHISKSAERKPGATPLIWHAFSMWVQRRLKSARPIWPRPLRNVRGVSPPDRGACGADGLTATGPELRRPPTRHSGPGAGRAWSVISDSRRSRLMPGHGHRQCTFGRGWARLRTRRPGPRGRCARVEQHRNSPQIGASCLRPTAVLRSLASSSRLLFLQKTS
jgi:hypothetical protein